MKTSILRQIPRTEDDVFLFAVPTLLLVAALAVCALMLILGAMAAEPASTTAVPAAESTAPSFVGA